MNALGPECTAPYRARSRQSRLAEGTRRWLCHRLAVTSADGVQRPAGLLVDIRLGVFDQRRVVDRLGRTDRVLVLQRRRNQVIEIACLTGHVVADIMLPEAFADAFAG